MAELSSTIKKHAQARAYGRAAKAKRCYSKYRKSTWYCCSAWCWSVFLLKPPAHHILTSLAAYCASKAAIINMTRSNAIDYSENAIRVNCVCPGVIETPMTTTSPEMVEALKPAINIAPMQRMGTPDEVADAVLFLCSTQASFIQGHALVVDGGYTIN